MRIKIKKNLLSQGVPEKEAERRSWAIAVAQWKKTHGGKAPTRGESSRWYIQEDGAMVFENMTVYDSLVIKEAVEKDNDFKVFGTAIHETTTRNKIKYTAEELAKAGHTFSDVPLLTDHKNSVYNIAGRTTHSEYYAGDGIRYEGFVRNDEIKAMIKDGRIKNVSIGAKVEKLIKEKESDVYVAKGIKGLEISFVAVSGDPIADVMHSIQEALNQNEIVKTGEIKMEDQKVDNSVYEKQIEDLKKQIENSNKKNEELIKGIEEQKAKEHKALVEETAKIYKKRKAGELTELSNETLKELIIASKELKEDEDADNQGKPEDDSKPKGEEEIFGNDYVVEKAKNGKINFFKIPDYSKQGWNYTKSVLEGGEI